MQTSNAVDRAFFNPNIEFPYELRPEVFSLAMQDVYDFFGDVNDHLLSKGLRRLDDTLRPAIMSGVLSDMLTASLAKHSRVLVENSYFNGHPDLVVQGVYPDNSVKAGDQGVEIKTTRKRGGAIFSQAKQSSWWSTERSKWNGASTAPAVSLIGSRGTEGAKRRS